MRIHYIYIFIGISTLALNFALTLHLIRKHTGANRKEIWDCDDAITFSLTRGEGALSATTMATPYDDTVPLE